MLRIASIFIIFALTVLLAACSTKSIPSSPTDWITFSSNHDFSLHWDKIDGKVLISGSATVYPLAKEAIDALNDQGVKASYTLEGIGTQAGLERFTKYGESDIAMASRPIHPEEMASAKAIGRNLMEFPIAWDALTVAVPVSNTFAENLSKAELVKLFTTAENWSDVRQGWPEKKIYRFVLGMKSGSTEFFAQTLLNGNKDLILKAKNTQTTEDDRIVVRGLESTPDAVGFVGISGWKNAHEHLRALSIEGALPSENSVRSGQYLLSRPLFLYTSTEVLKTNPAAASLLGLLLQNYGVLIEKSGFFPVSPEILANNERLWRKAFKEDS